MATSDDPTTDATASVVESYVLDVRIVDHETDAGRSYRFEAPHHEGRTFEDADTARLYADVYFDVNGFEEAGTGERGVPPEVIQGGRDTLAAYFLTLPGADVHWVASFFGKRPAKIEEYATWVRERAAEIRAGVAEREAATE
jgi:hypothetical protein